MASLNRVFLLGNLTRDPAVRYLSSGKAVADLGMATNRVYRTREGDEQQDTCFVNVVAWDRQAETAGEFLHKGSQVLVEGALRFESWERDGEKRSALKVHADRIQFLDRPGKAEYGNAPVRTYAGIAGNVNQAERDGDDNPTF